MLELTQRATYDYRRALAGYHAIDTISCLAKTGSISERRLLLDQLIENDIIGVCVSVSPPCLCVLLFLTVG